MKAFTIDSENNITFHHSLKETGSIDAISFVNQSDFNKLAAAWPAERLVDVWNSLPGMKQAVKIKDRKKAYARIWT